ncbi:hypothetical protein DMN91_008555 [Ooceraea biroi]|uniref:TIL domain-containing protein n=1 Tax=Ooceraea biroi TaxID=2015173 RepID=A0A3L8DE77_OOCBI|nr:chymotrypsin inhibitor-like [Ooceraea biroi]RLU18199.1 hypothetical protein DMN91_008555 [Ooceraea biroi]
MSRAIFLLLAIGVLVCVTSAQETHQCTGENEEWNSCGSACPPTCNEDPHRPCTLQCVQGCFCKQGLMRNSVGHCVNPHAC